MTRTAPGLSSVGVVPALVTSKRSPARWRRKPSAIWLRQELAVQRNRTRIFFTTGSFDSFGFPIHCIRIGEYTGRKKTTPDNNPRIYGLIPHAWHRRQFQEHRESSCPGTSKYCDGRRSSHSPADSEPKARSFVFPPNPLSASNSSGAKQSAEGPAEPSPSLPRTSPRPSEDKGCGVESGPKMP